MKKKDSYIYIRINHNEKEKIRELAHSKEMTMSDFIRMVVLERKN